MKAPDWKALASRIAWGSVAAAVGAGLMLVGECNSFRSDRQKDATPVLAPPTKLEVSAPPVVLPCRDVQAIEPTPKQRETLAKRYNKPELAAPVGEDRAFKMALDAILGERLLPPMPSGGTGLLTLTPEGRVDLTVAPKPEPLWDWHSTYEAGAVYGIGTGGDTRGRAWVAVEPLRFARLHARAEAGVDLRSGQSDAYIMGGFVFRSR